MNSSVVFKKINLTEENHFTWQLPNRVLNGKQDSIHCTFKMGSRIGLPYDCEWTCRLIQNGGFLGTLEIELSKRPPSLEEFNGSFECVIYKVNQRDSSLYATTVGGFTVNLAKQKWSSLELRPSDQAGSPRLPNGCSLKFEITSKLGSPKYKTVDATLNSFKVKFTEKLQSDLASMLELSTLSRADKPTIIVCKAENVEFPVIRGILAARSIVFSTMFESQMKENQTGIVEVADVSSAVMKILLHFLYTGKLLENWKAVSTVELLYAAAKYEVRDLLDFLDVVLGKVCNIENVGNLLNLAKKLNLNRAENDLFNLIKNSSQTLQQLEKLMMDVDANIVFEFGCDEDGI